MRVLLTNWSNSVTLEVNCIDDKNWINSSKWKQFSKMTSLLIEADACKWFIPTPTLGGHSSVHLFTDTVKNVYNMMARVESCMRHPITDSLSGSRDSVKLLENPLRKNILTNYILVFWRIIVKLLQLGGTYITYSYCTLLVS